MATPWAIAPLPECIWLPAEEERIGGRGLDLDLERDAGMADFGLWGTAAYC